MCLTIPEYDWDKISFAVNEGAAAIKRHNRIFISHSSFATDHNCCMWLLYTDEDADLLDPAYWSKPPEPLFQSCHERSIDGPGHNSFKIPED